MSDLVGIALQIQTAIKDSQDLSKRIPDLYNKAAETKATYEHNLGATILALSKGISFKLDDLLTEKVSVTNQEKVARAICSKEKEEADKAEYSYKYALSLLSRKGEHISALQSLLRHLD